VPDVVSGKIVQLGAKAGAVEADAETKVVITSTVNTAQPHPPIRQAKEAGSLIPDATPDSVKQLVLFVVSCFILPTYYRHEMDSALMYPGVLRAYASPHKRACFYLFVAFFRFSVKLC